MSWLFESGDQIIGASASASVLPMDIQDWFPLGLTGWISLQSRDSHESSPTPQFKSINSSVLSFFFSFYFLLKDNCFTEFCCFLSNLNMNQPSVQFSSVTQSCLFVTAACQASLFITSSRTLLKLMSIASVMPSNHLILCHPLLLPPSIFPSIGVFSKESVLRIRWPKYWSLNFSICPSNEYSGLISFIIDWFDHLAVQGTLKSLLQHHSSKLSILWRSTFFIVQLSHPYIWKTTALTRRTFVGRVVSAF